jgi:hypothetical protein
MARASETTPAIQARRLCCRHVIWANAKVQTYVIHYGDSRRRSFQLKFVLT